MSTLLKPVQESKARLSKLLGKSPRPKFTRNQLLTIGLIGVPVALGGILAIKFMASLPAADLDKGLIVHDRAGKVVCTMLDENRISETIPLKNISPFVKKAVLAAEDGGFYKHNGVDLGGIARAVLTDISSKKMVQGGSTITQQLAKVLYFETSARTIPQKIRETILAFQLEGKYSKDKIFDAYLNNIYLGQGAYGVERAARTYFGKSASQLDLAESSCLAAMITSPSVLSRSDHRKELTQRQHNILDEMVSDKTITKAQADAAKKKQLKFKLAANSSPSYMSFLDCVTNQLERVTKTNSPWTRGWHVYTTMDQSAQRAAYAQLTEGVRKAPGGVTQGALVSLSVEDGSVLAMVGGRGSKNSSQFNRAIAPHTTGSSFKPFVYLAALEEQKIQPDSVILDAPFDRSSNASYDPANFDGNYMGWMSVRRALALSRNTCAVRVLDVVGAGKVAETATKAGIKSEMYQSPSLALGACAASPLEMATAYSTLARGGTYIESTMINRVTDSNDKTIFERNPEGKKVLSTEACAQLVDVLQDVVQKGTGTRARLYDRPVAGKTGTSDGARDLWFVGFTPDMVTAVWMGNDHNKRIPGMSVTGGTVAAGVWRNYMQAFYKAHPTAAGRFPEPANPLMDDSSSFMLFPQGTSLFGDAGEFVEEIIEPDGNIIESLPFFGRSERDERGVRRSYEVGREAQYRPKHKRDFDDDIDHEFKKEIKRSGPIRKLFRKIKDWF